MDIPRSLHIGVGFEDRTLTNFLSPPRGAGHPRYLTFTSMLRGFASGRFLISISRTPFLKAAWTLSASASSGSVNALLKADRLRSRMTYRPCSSFSFFFFLVGFDHQSPVLNADGDVFLGHAGKLGLHQVTVRVFAHIDGGNSGPGQVGGKEGIAAEEGLDHVVEIFKYAAGKGRSTIKGNVVHTKPPGSYV